MENTFIAQSSTLIDASPSKVWDALINPEMIKRYLYGTEALSDWKQGSPITYKGIWEGKPYEDKGIIKKIEPEKLLQSTYWSSMSGTEDRPENYVLVTYELTGEGDKTRLTITQDNCKTEQSRQHSQDNWNMVLATLKQLLETDAK
ncbi:MAG TPA: SRPBCC domain-containing protein [Chitinophagaceae bacterium]|nr:SRPBCC domain-containing protein [Chitinophagaceae bacterium]